MADDGEHTSHRGPGHHGTGVPHGPDGDLAAATARGTTSHAPTDPDQPSILGTATAPGADRLAESLARIGVLLGADRVELYRHRGDGTTRLAAWWRALGARLEGAPGLTDPIATDWFPWGLGHVRAERFVMVPDAAHLPLAPGEPATVGDSGTAACLHLPLRLGPEADPFGAVCAYWSEPPDGAPSEIDVAAELGREALLDCV